MSKANPTPVEKVQLQFDCAHCAAPAGEWCVRRRRGPFKDVRIDAQLLHSARFYSATIAGDLPLPIEVAS